MLSGKEYDAVKENRYKEMKEAFDKVLKGYKGIPNIKGFQKAIRDTKEKIKALENGLCFAKDDVEVRQAEVAMARRSGELQAYEETLASIKKRIKEVCKEDAA